jgi:predicted O-methyltransferase YrrM
MVSSLKCDVIDEIYRTGQVMTAAGRVPALSIVVREFAEALYGVIRRESPELVLEVGMAYGVTTAAIAHALRDNGRGRVISVDPYQTTQWQSGGLTTLDLTGLSDLHELREEPDFVALPALLKEGRTFGVAYIDGLHNLEYALLDFFYVDRMLAVSGVVGFNDCDWPTVMPTLRFVQHYRRYEEILVGLPALYGTRNAVTRKIAQSADRLVPGRITRSRILGPMIGRRREDRYFRKIEKWEPQEGFYWPIAR